MRRVNKGERPRVSLTLNGRKLAAEAEPRMLLSDFLRHGLGATGTHVGCEHGICGSCTVLIDGVAQRSCLTLAVQAEGREVRTVELLAAPDGTLNPLQQAFRNNHALQCGFCTPGILMSFTDFLARNPHPTEAEIREVLSGHLCRCTGYAGIVEAIKEVTDAPQLPRHPCKSRITVSAKMADAVADWRPSHPRALQPVPQRGSPSVVPSNPNSRLGRTASPLAQGGVKMDAIFVGIDVSKDRLDVHVCPSGEAFAVCATARVCKN